jgi:hypothetical protein
VPVDEKAAQRDIERLRKYRTWERGGRLGDEVLRQTRSLEKLLRSLAGVGERWGSLLPPELLARTQLRGLNRGVLTVSVADASTDYELDRWLRGGGLEALRRAGAAVTRVKTVLTSGDRPAREGTTRRTK